ncbi:hypothetical protein FOZ60_011835 [Perkinsus olseni]|uniref:Amino acid transporter transmembrane domain-containing protein n=1 Tax=Perkinsus olseni TaxID=32597 RepID=A0A7J6PMC1_PEROL|nr:hypothetical protein FOZ60_011835 [Perkinsus olseni]
MKAEHDEKKCTNLHAIVNVILAAIGLGVVSLPSIIARCGWVGGILLLLAAALVTDYLICKLHTAVSIHPSGTPIHTYEQLGRVCFGRVGQILVVAVVHLTMTGVCSAMLLLLGQNTEKMLPQLSVKVWTCIWAALCAPLSWLRSFKEISYVSAVGLIGILGVFVIIAARGIDHGANRGDEVQHDVVRPDLLMWTVSFGNAVLSYQIANVTPTLIRDMRTPASFPKVVSLGLLIVFMVYVGLGASGYYGYGRSLIDDPIINSIAPAGSTLDAWGYALVVAILVMCFPHYLVMLLPIVASIEYAFHVDVMDTSLRSFTKRIVLRTLFVGFTLIVAIAVPSVEKLVDLLGVFTMVIIAMLLPAILYCRMRILNEGSLKKIFTNHPLEMLVLTFLTLLAVVIMVVGGYAAIDSFQSP